MTNHAPGTPIWVDLSTPDVEASLEFYGELFGWTATPDTGEFAGYRNFMEGDCRIAGVGPLMQDGQPVVWSSYVSVEDAEATAAKVEAAGGQVIVPPMPIGELGSMAVFIDTIGAAVGVWQPGQHKGSGKFNEPYSLAWNELTCGAGKASEAASFYAAVFGWTAETSDMGGFDYTNFSLEGNEIAGMIPMTDPAHAEMSFWNVYFAVEDCDATVAKAIQLGATQFRGPTDIPAGRFAVLQDPQGAAFSVIALPAT